MSTTKCIFITWFVTMVTPAVSSPYPWQIDVVRVSDRYHEKNYDDSEDDLMDLITDVSPGFQESETPTLKDSEKQVTEAKVTERPGRGKSASKAGAVLQADYPFKPMYKVPSEDDNVEMADSTSEEGGKAQSGFPFLPVYMKMRDALKAVPEADGSQKLLFESHQFMEDRENSHKMRKRRGVRPRGEMDEASNDDDGNTEEVEDKDEEHKVKDQDRRIWPAIPLPDALQAAYDKGWRG
ncbi:uncharacterized protein [Ptychodera flava]|uniref:uncharacterized protein n=1 Tax=Ptychodera flava TaxID=63121 RepID=UPI00396A5C63